jgi:hypothetical protein
VHMASLACARRLARADALSDGAERALNRLSRTYVAQIDALARYRAGDARDASRPEMSAGEGGEASFEDGTQAPPVEASGAAVPRARDRVGCAKSPGAAKRTRRGVRAILRTLSAARNDHPRIDFRLVRKIAQAPCEIAAPRRAILHTLRADAAHATVPRTQVPRTHVPRVTEPAFRATAPPSRGETTSLSQPEIAPAFARRARADAARSPA